MKDVEKAEMTREVPKQEAPPTQPPPSELLPSTQVAPELQGILP